MCIFFRLIITSMYVYILSLHYVFIFISDKNNIHNTTQQYTLQGVEKQVENLY